VVVAMLLWSTPCPVTSMTVIFLSIDSSMLLCCESKMSGVIL
jgi:hypothetical protein